MKKIILMVSLALVSFGAFSQHDNGSHNHAKENHIEPMFENQKMTKAYAEYIQLKDALVASNLANVKKAAETLQKTLALVSGVSNAKAEAAKVSNATSLDKQRKAFADLSDEMTKLVKQNKPTMGEIYVEHCPMANGNTGAYWLSNEKEIKNPYFGDKMLKCGSIKETIK